MRNDAIDFTMRFYVAAPRRARTSSCRSAMESETTI